MGMFAIHIPTYKSTGVNCWWVWPHQPLVSTLQQEIGKSFWSPCFDPSARQHSKLKIIDAQKYNQRVGYGHFGRQWKFHHVSLLSGWWFQTFFLFSISYVGCHPSHGLIFFKMVSFPPTSYSFHLLCNQSSPCLRGNHRNVRAIRWKAFTSKSSNTKVVKTRVKLTYRMGPQFVS